MDGLYVVGLCSILILFLIALWAGLQVAEIAIPGFSEWLDTKVGPEPEWRRWR